MNAAPPNGDGGGNRPAGRFSWLDIHHVHPHRALTLMALGAIVGLILAGFSLFTAKGTSTLIVPPEDVALVNQQPVSRSDFMAQLTVLYGGDPALATREQRQKVLNDMIREELFVQRGKELDVASVDPDVRAAMVSSVEQQAAASALTAVPSDAKLMAWWKSHQDAYSSEGLITVRDLVFPAARGAAAAQALKGGASPDAVAAQFGGKDSGKVDGEEYYFAAKIHLGDALFAQARALANGASAGPFPAADGAHVLYMVKNVSPVALAFPMAREQVLSDYRRDAMQRTLTGDEGFLRKRANVLVAKDLR
jgi:parvulin-like peptidyl-prolyl isomerase